MMIWGKILVEDCDSDQDNLSLSQRDVLCRDDQFLLDADADDNNSLDDILDGVPDADDDDDAFVDADSVTDSVTDSDSDSMVAVVRYLYW